MDVELTIERLLYVYQYMSFDRQLIFRYDNTGHHRRLNLPTYPHHKHEGDDGTIVSSQGPDLDGILAEIEAVVELP